MLQSSFELLARPAAAERAQDRDVALACNAPLLHLKLRYARTGIATMAKVKIVRQSMNTDRAHALGLILKLDYVFPERDKPHLEVFLDDEQARAGDWAIYGADPMQPDKARIVKFTGLNQTRQFELGRRFQIEFTDLTEETVNYARTGKAIEPAYHFQIRASNDQ